MKKITLNNRLVTIISLLLITSSSYAQNLLINGDFEATEAPFAWVKNNNDVLLNEKNEYSIHASELNDNGNCRMPGLGAARWITQSVDIPSSGTYTFKFTARVQNAANFASGESENNHATLGIATVTGEIFPFEADGTTVGSTALGTITTQSSSNEEVSASVEIGGEITKVQVKISKNWNVAFIDDVYLGLPTNGINEQHILDMHVVSNNGMITVNCPSVLQNIKIFDMSGKTIWSTSDINTYSTQFTCPTESGLYMIVATDNQGKTGVVKHFIK